MKVPYEKTREPVSYYMETFENRAKYNAIKRDMTTLTEAMSVRDVDAAERIIEKMQNGIRSSRITQSGKLRGFDEIAEEVIADYRIAQFSGGMRGITSGWPEIDAATGGFANGDVITWVARPGRGKTYLLLKQAFAAAMQGKRTLFISPEVPELQLVRRMIGILTGINPRLIARGQLSTEVFAGMIETIDGIRGQLPIEFMAGKYKKTIPFMNQMIEEYEPDYACIDASYLVDPEKKRGNSGSRREVISDVAEGIKDSAATYNIPFNHTVQFNRTAVRADKPDTAQTNETRTRQDPLAHMDIHKIGETDVIGQISSLVFVVELGDPPYQYSSRYIGIKKGREGESGWWKINYLFNPFNFGVIENGNQINSQVEEVNEDDLDEEI